MKSLTDVSLASSLVIYGWICCSHCDCLTTCIVVVGVALILLYTSCQVRTLMISRMAKPEEVLVVENEQGEVVREFMKDTDVIFMYKNMRETLVYLTHVDYADTERIMTQKLANQVMVVCY